ncbi:MAG TPA: DMT family transporter [Oculatellaceae cyanobacterium]
MTRFYIVGFFVLMCFDTLAQMGFNSAAATADAYFPKVLDGAAILIWITQLLVRQRIFLPVIGYLGAFITWMTLLKHAPIGPAFAASHLHIVSVVLLSCLFLHEKLTWLQVCGCLFILGGIFVLAAETGGEQKLVMEDSEDHQKKSHISQA